MLRIAVVLICFIGFPLLADTGPNVITRTVESPHHYEFAGRKASMTYTAAGLDSEPMLTYRLGSREPRHFMGDEIRMEASELGQLVTVTLWTVSDLKTITFTLLIPAVNIEGTDPRLFETKSIVTSHHTTIAGPDYVQGPLKSYLTGNLLALASHADSPSTDEPGVFGKVTVSPTCPGPQRPGQICTGPFSEAEVTILDENDQIIESSVTDENGLFSIRSEPGQYTIHVNMAGVFPACPETPVTVPNGLVAVKIHCDTGIR